jgi:hypothetical protein
LLDKAKTVLSLSPKFRIVSIIPGIDTLAPDLTETNKGFFISPNFLFDLQSNFKQFNFGTYFVDGVLGFGVWYRHTNFLNPNSDQFKFQDALILMGGIENKKLRIGYSYDISLSTLVINSGGAHEISITFDLPQKESKSDKYRVIYCPVF